MNSSVHSVPCLICQEADAKVLFRGTGSAGVVRCNNEGLVYLTPRPEDSDLRHLHSNFVRRDNFELFYGYRRAMLQREANIIKKAKRCGNLLDIGCATGTFFENFDDAQWRLFGVDTSNLGAERARANYGANIFCGTLADAQHPASFFDVVTMLDTIYYLPDPLRELKEINRVLKDDGVLAIEIPGLTYTLFREEGPLCWLLDRKWRRGLANSFHLYYFSPKTIRMVLAKAGFTVFQMVPEQASLGGGIIQRVLNEIHFGIARLLFKCTAGKLSLAGKELYLARKEEGHTI